MSDYQPPIQDMMFTLFDVLGFEHEDMDRDTTAAVLEEAAKLASNVLAPLNTVGDEHGATLKDGEVSTAPGFKEAYAEYRDGGWNSVPFTEEFGGQGLPWGIAFPIQEMWQAANMSFGLCPLLNQGSVDAILHHGSDALKEKYLPKMISGEWTGTMNLTEPQAGSDLGLLRAKAEPDGDHYKVSGQKIFITYGEHDMAENIIHLVLARLPDAPEDVKGISLFVVPKFLDDGSRNSAQCIGLEHKLGIHASPTCTMEFDEAIGYLCGEPHQGLKAMFTMMNNARLSVGLQGVALGERSYQHALAFAQERVQGKSLSAGERVAIAEHPDVQRMLLTMKVSNEAGRLLTYEAAVNLDRAHGGDTDAQAKVDLLTPIVKAWSTDLVQETTSLGVQIHGGMGFVEETGAAQYYRDARILPIYEGTNGIQAADLAFRKILRDGGEAAGAYCDYLKSIVPGAHQDELGALIDDLKHAIEALVKLGADKKLDEVAGSSVPLLKGFGVIAGGVYLALAAEKSKGYEDQGFAAEKQKTAAFFMGNILPLATAHLKIAQRGYESFVG